MKKGKSLIGLIFIVVGMVFVSIPLYSEWQQSQNLSQLEGALASLEVDQLSGTSQGSIQWSEEELKNVMTLEIPSIDLEQYVLDETTEENLAVALTQIKQNQYPGEGNFSIAGHRGYRGDRHFRQLSNVSKGDEVHLHSSGKTFVYEVSSISIVEPTQLEVLDDSDQAEITLITCTLSGEQRLVVKGNLLKVIEKSQST